MKWIDINDERPEKGKLVLVCNPEWKSPNILIASMNYDWEWEFSCYMPVKYWMELPELPLEDRSETSEVFNDKDK